MDDEDDLPNLEDDTKQVIKERRLYYPSWMIQQEEHS